MDEGTSDYDPSLAETQFGSLTSSVTGHIWEYGRCVSHHLYHHHRDQTAPLILLSQTLSRLQAG